MQENGLLERIRAATSQDIEALHSLVNSAYRGESSRQGWTTEADFLDGQRVDPEGLLEIIEAPQSTILVSENSKGILTGCVHLRILPDGWCYLGMLTVAPALQAKGLGKRLLEAAENWAKEHSCPGVRMYVIWLRLELIDYYRRRGYQLTGQREPFPYGSSRFGLPKRQDLHFVTLQKPLVN
ncbi:MAG: GNAT family N-acetyltransferase [Bdellovibrionaceae bacterium]|nr:GNAT family N-acetyltransferase [Pseudobdellovibrionaceae bacterium]